MPAAIFLHIKSRIHIIYILLIQFFPKQLHCFLEPDTLKYIFS